jgi:hypothetical protein
MRATALDHSDAPGSVDDVEQQSFPPSDELVIKRLQGHDLETVLASSAVVRRAMRESGRQLVASSWRTTSRGVAMELAFSPGPSRD